MKPVVDSRRFARRAGRCIVAANAKRPFALNQFAKGRMMPSDMTIDPTVTQPNTRGRYEIPNRFSPGSGELQYRNQEPDTEAFDEHAAMFMMDRESELERSSGSRPAIFPALALGLGVLAIGFAVVLHYSSSPTEPPTAATGMQQAPATAPALSRPAAPSPVAEAPKEPAAAPKPLAAEPSLPAQTERLAARAPEQPAAAGTAPAPAVPRATRPTANVPEQQPGGTATLVIAVSPRGEIYIDGKHHGTTPPITTLDLEPGMHRIEVRSGSRKPYLTYMTVEAGDVRRIRHDFAAKPSRPPT
jgi:hypothetical protein